jgi:MinD superfamily P-loop ATPase
LTRQRKHTIKHAICIASGKGGTGKTTIATNLAVVLAREGLQVQLLDADVEAPNCHLFLNPEIEREFSVELLVPEIDESRCTFCGECAQVCEFNAIAVFGKSVLVFPELCHACGGCVLACPESAITEKGHKTGVVRTGHAGSLRFVSGELAIGEAKSTPIIREVKKHRIDGLNIIDAPPGTSCPVVEAVKDANYVLLVTEPTPFGLNDLVLAVEMVRKLSRPFGVVINRADVGDDRIVRYCRREGIPILLEIPERRAIAEAYSSGRLIVDTDAKYAALFYGLYERVLTELKRNDRADAATSRREHRPFRFSAISSQNL